MREIKFRAWDKLDDKFITHEQLMNQAFNVYKSINTENTNWKYQQYTGLKDKNGVEIYEGDIVSLDSWSPKEMQIFFIEGAFCLANKDGQYVGDIHYIHHAGIEQCSVIGNIYQNKELLN